MAGLLLRGKTALITGATSGIGMATVRIFVKEGAKVCATGRNEAVLRQLSDETGCHFVVGDLTREGDPGRVVHEGVAKLDGNLSTLVNCAGVLKGGAFGSDACNLANYKFNFSANTQAVFEMMEHGIPHLKRAGLGSSIVNVSSVNGKQSFGGVANYCASKAAVDMFSRCAAVDLAADGVRVNAVNPGVTITELQKRGGLDDATYAALIQRSIDVTHPLAKARGKMPEADEVGDLIAFLSSDKAGFITGECIAIDGGRQCLGAR